MNICYLADARAEHTRRWAKYFALKGHRVNIVTLNPLILNAYEQVQVHLVRKPKPSSNTFSRIWNLPSVLSKTKRILKDICPDVLHAHSAGGYAWLAMVTGFHPYVVTPWGTDILIDVKKSWRDCLVTKLALRHADLVTCDAYHMRDELIRLGAYEKNIQLVMFGTDVKRFSPKDVQDNNLRDQYGLGSSQIVISTRTLTPIHDLGTLMRTIPLIRLQVPSVNFVIVGDGPERRFLEAQAESLGVSKFVSFIGRVEEDEMVKWLQTADVYVSTSLNDAGLAASTAEAMACGLPVVVTDNGDNRRWVGEGEGGFLIPNGASGTLADRVILLLRNREMCKRFAYFNRKVIQERNNHSMEMDRMETMYQKLSYHCRTKSHS